MKIQILGTGCTKCKTLFEITSQATEELGIICEIEKITDINQIIDLGVMITPALVVDGEVKFSGKLPSLEDVKAVLKV
jgi:small redox-active disulfide protein 2